MYRAYVFINGIRLTSGPCPSVGVADSLLSTLLAVPGVSGGGIEEHVDGIGWCAHIPECDRELCEIC